MDGSISSSFDFSQQSCPSIGLKPAWLGTASSFSRRLTMYEFLQERVETNMTHSVRSVAPETTVGDLYRLFAADDFDAYPVVRGDALVGIVSKLDALNVFALSQDHILPRYKEGMATIVDEIMTSDVVTVDGETSLQRVLELMVKHRV